jgi:hypothetical protein
VGRIECCSDVPGIAVRISELVPETDHLACTVIVGDRGHVHLYQGVGTVPAGDSVCKLVGQWTASTLAHALLDYVRAKGLV